MLDGKLAEIYLALWTHSDQSDPPCWTLYRDPDSMPYLVPGERLCAFVESEFAIWIERERVPGDCRRADVAGASLDELIGLAHERGHEASKRAGTYVANDPAEEVRAWDTARGLLAGLGFESWAAFENLRTRALASYLNRQQA